MGLLLLKMMNHASEIVVDMGMDNHFFDGFNSLYRIKVKISGSHIEMTKIQIQPDICPVHPFHLGLEPFKGFGIGIGALTQIGSCIFKGNKNIRVLARPFLKDQGFLVQKLFSLSRERLLPGKSPNISSGIYRPG